MKLVRVSMSKDAEDQIDANVSGMQSQLVVEESWDIAMFTCRAAPHCRENGREHLKKAVSLGFWHFQPTSWK
jgi:hypothetical protein